MTTHIEQIIELLKACTSEQRHKIFQELRKEFSIHPLEEELNIQAEIILESISRAGGLTLRMMRGVIAEAAFEIEVVSKLKGWKDITPSGDLPYDFRLDDGKGSVRVQVKLQRSKDDRPAVASDGYRRFSSDMYLIEPQKTRRGERKGQSTRFYEFGEFDILVASMQPSTKNWGSFMYTVSNWLLPDSKDKSKILKFQPIPMQPNDDWTDDFEICVQWLRSGVQKQIRTTPYD